MIEQFMSSIVSVNLSMDHVIMQIGDAVPFREIITLTTSQNVMTSGYTMHI